MSTGSTNYVAERAHHACHAQLGVMIYPVIPARSATRQGRVGTIPPDQDGEEQGNDFFI
jgi:hypothetical protein